MPVEIIKQEFPELTIGCSVHSIEEARIAEQQGADYVMFGYVYSTQSKPRFLPKGLGHLRSISESVSIPVIAIVGITPANSRGVIEAGAQGIAVVSGILEAEDPLEAVQQYGCHLSG